jgi:hypothetical protein
MTRRSAQVGRPREWPRYTDTAQSRQVRQSCAAPGKNRQIVPFGHQSALVGLLP